MDPKNPSEVLGLTQLVTYSISHASANVKSEKPGADLEAIRKADSDCYRALDEMFRTRVVKTATECR
jgi:hypothetical protein